MSEIKFYVPESETIPTDLRLLVGGVNIRYERIYGGFRFYIDLENEEDAMEIATGIVKQMILDHDESEHCVTWRTKSLEVVPQEGRYKFGTIIDWKYRVRDSY